MKLVVSGKVGVAADAGSTFAAATDWESQGAWMPATRVRHVGGARDRVDGQLEAFTGFGRLGFLDTMRITEWDPPRSCRVLHTGRAIKGTAVFAVEPVGASGSIFAWTEELDVPVPRALALLRFPIGWGTRLALQWAGRRFSKWVAAGAPPLARTAR